VANFIVTTLQDENDPTATVGSPGGTGLSLREALTLANGAPDTDTITFDPALAGQTLALTQGELVISSNVTIQGSGVTVDGNDASRVFDVTAGISELDHLTITHGYAAGGHGGGVLVAAGASLTIAATSVTENAAEFLGGGISSSGTLTLTDSTVADNSAVNGGGVHNGGTVTLTNVTLAENNADNGGGLYNAGTATLTDVTIVGNAVTGDGGAINNDGTASVTNATLTGNHADVNAGGIVGMGALTLANSIVVGNTAATSNGDVDPMHVTFIGGNVVGIGSDTDASDHVVQAPSFADLFAAVGHNPNTGVLSGLLADNGGPVETVALATTPSNPALDAGDDTLAPTTDARGLAHTDLFGVAHNGSNISDLGAFEQQLAHTFVVTTLNDGGADGFDGGDLAAEKADGGGLSLREALALANADPTTADTIKFTADLTGGSTAGVDDGHLTLTQGELVITGSVTIEGDVNGDGTPDITIDGAYASRVLHAVNGTSTLDGLTITGGNANYGFDVYGGGVAVGTVFGQHADVTISNSTITGNIAGYGGGASVDFGSALHLVNSTVSANAAIYIGGGIASHGELTVVNSTVSDNTAVYVGGGIANDGLLSILNSTLAGNQTHGLGPGYAPASGGGGLYNAGIASLTNTTISGNHSAYAGGGIYNSSDLTLTNVTVANNSSATYGGGLYNAACGCGDVTVNSSTFTGNVAEIGGGIYNANGTVALANTIVAGNGGYANPDIGTSAFGTTSFGGVNVISQGGGLGGPNDINEPNVANIFDTVVTVDPDGTPNTGDEFLAGVLANNGGPTQTVAIKAFGAAFDAGSNADLPADTDDLDHDGNTAEPLPEDARGLTRVVGSTVDVGAFEIANTPPTESANAPLVLDEGTSATITAAVLSYTDAQQGAADLTFTITTAVTVGTLLLNGSALGLGTTFTQADIDAGHLSYAHDGSETTATSFGFSVSDGVGGVTSGHSFTIDINPVNDPPVVGPQITLASIGANSGAHLITQADLLVNASDVDGPSLSAINLQIDKGLGTLVDNHNGTWTYTPKINDDTFVTFSYQVTDGVAAPVADSATLDIVPAQSAPQIGTPGDDTFTAVTGNSQYDGLGGVDTIIFGFKLVDATVTYSGNHVTIDGPMSHTVLSGFEKYAFTDGTVNNADGDPLVDALFYYSRNHDVWNAHVEADTHYHTFGWREGRDPDAFFSTSTYLSLNPGVKAAGVDPVVQFDQGGWKTSDPSIYFDNNAYLNANPDVKAAGLDPLAHFLANGAEEGRQPIAPAVLLAANGFDYVYYLQHNPDVAAARVDPLQHFETVGWREGRNPNAYFDTSGYLAHYGDVAAAGVNPLDQYNQSGWKEGRDPSVNFDTTDYLSHYPDVTAAHVNPLTHFLQHGQFEGRSSFADGVWG
jgi:hypothetical protein